ncbi:MAG TPA: sigma-70 family RNA polymerase sigma factor [Gemmataceae bacterium]|nr:sigma-70 family RNA polymerase sigma factor [Gemmataceae bacterium]
MASDHAPDSGHEVSPRATDEPSDHSLLRRFRRGSQDAATQLYLRYAHRLRALVRANCSTELTRRVEPDDIVQSVFRRFFRRVLVGDYDVPPGEELWGLLLVIALNKIRSEESFHRAGKRDIRLTVAGGDAEGLLAAHSGNNEAAFAVLQLTIDEALDTLPQHQRHMAELRIQGHEIAEIAQQTGRSRRTVERLLQEVRKKLKGVLEQEGASS